MLACVILYTYTDTSTHTHTFDWNGAVHGNCSVTSIRFAKCNEIKKLHFDHTHSFTQQRLWLSRAQQVCGFILFHLLFSFMSVFHRLSMCNVPSPPSISMVRFIKCYHTPMRMCVAEDLHINLTKFRESSFEFIHAIDCDQVMTRAFRSIITMSSTQEKSNFSFKCSLANRKKLKQITKVP